MSIIIPYINIHTHNRGENEISISSVGIHPLLAESGIKLNRESITSDTQSIGEIGLDFSRPIDRQLQERLFCEQLHIAEELKLPVVLHSVRAVDRTLEILKQFKLQTAIFHGFIGSEQQASNAIRQGYYLSFGHRCFASPKSLIALRNSPLKSIFLETDEHNITIQEIYRLAAAERSESLEEIKKQIYINYKIIFNK
ncbi:MAG: TatD family hydrolase [Rikenellaceae bacterium]